MKFRFPLVVKSSSGSENYFIVYLTAVGPDLLVVFNPSCVLLMAPSHTQRR
uniref:Uncharacterized protein n=1 Tax=Daphnia magna TaxID=35525 RepID=A0A0P5E8H2_9CRUS